MYAIGVCRGSLMRTPTELVDEPETPQLSNEDWTVEVEGSPSKFPGLAKFGLAVGVLAAFIVILMFAVPPLLPQSWTKEMAEPVVGDALGVQIDISGDHSLRLLPTVRLSATGITARKENTRAVSFDIAELEVELGALGLMAGTADVQRVSIIAPSIRVDLGAGTQLSVGGQSIDRAWGWWRDMSIQSLNISGGKVVVLGRDGTLAYDVSDLFLKSVEPASGEAADGLALDGGAMVNGEIVKVRISTSDPELFVLGNRWPVKVQVRSALLEAEFNGSLAKRQQLLGHGDLSMRSDDAAALNAWIGPLIPARPFSTMDITAGIELDGDSAAISNAVIEVGDTKATADLLLHGLNTGVLKLEGTIAASLMDLSGGDTMTDLISGQRTLGTMMLPASNIDITWQRLLWGMHELGPGTAKLIRSDNGPRLTIIVDNTETYGGTLQGQVTIDASEGMRAIDSEFSLIGVEIGPLSATSSMSFQSPITGQAVFNIKLFSVGSDPAQITEALVGNAEIVIKDGVFSVPELTSGLLNSGRVGIPFKTVTGQFRIGQGIAKSEDIVLRADGVSLIGNGSIDLTDGRMDLDIRRLGGTGSAAGQKRFRVTGPSDNLTVEEING